MKATVPDRILSLLASRPNDLLSIADIAKSLSIAYSHAHRFVRQLVAQNVLTIRTIGGAHICTLNTAEPLTYALLAALSYRAAREWFSKNPHAQKILDRIDAHKDALAIVALHNKRTILIPQKPADFSAFHNRSVLTARDLKKEYYKDIVVIYGAETYWREMYTREAA